MPTEQRVISSKSKIGGKSAGEHDDESQMGELDAELAPGPTEAADVGGDQVQ